MPLPIPHQEAAGLVRFMAAARAELAESRAASAIAAAAEPVPTRETLARLLAELAGPADGDGTVVLRVVDDDQFYAAVRHLRGIVAWLSVLYERGELAAGDPACAVPIIDHLLRYAHHRHLARLAGQFSDGGLPAVESA